MVIDVQVMPSADSEKLRNCPLGLINPLTALWMHFVGHSETDVIDFRFEIVFGGCQKENGLL